MNWDTLETDELYDPLNLEHYTGGSFKVIGFKKRFWGLVESPVVRLTENLELRLSNKRDEFGEPVFQPIVVREGFECDFASSPATPVLRFLFPPLGTYFRDAVIHDYLYRNKPFSRMLADAIFRDAMQKSGVGFVKRWLMWLAVRLFGRFVGWKPSK